MNPQAQQGQKQNARMPKAQALTLVRQLKRGIVVASFLGFGTFSALVMSHTVGASAQQTTKTQKATPTAIATQQTTPPTTTATTTPATATPTTTQQGGGYGFGTNPPTSNPVSGSHTS